MQGRQAQQGNAELMRSSKVADAQLGTQSCRKQVQQKLEAVQHAHLEQHDSC